MKYRHQTTAIKQDVKPGSIILNLTQNYPNPFNNTTNIRYFIPSKSDVSINIYNILGEKVRSFKRRHNSAGEYSVRWDGKSEQGKAVSSGIYFYRMAIHSDRMTAGSFTQIKRMLLLR